MKKTSHLDRISYLPEVAPSQGIAAQARVEPEIITIFQGWTRFTTNNQGEMQGEPLEGLFCAETRFLTNYSLSVNNKPISHRLSIQLSANEWTSSGAILNSGDSGNLPDGTLPKGSIEVRLLRKCEKGVFEQIYVKNNGIPPRTVHLVLNLSCPILDAEFDEEMKKDKKIATEGVRPKILDFKNGILLSFEKIFGKRKRTPTRELTALYGSKSPQDGELVTRGLDIFVSVKPGNPQAKLKIIGQEQTQIHLWTELDSREEICLLLGYEPIINGIRMPAPQFEGLVPPPRSRTETLDYSLRLMSSNSTLNFLVDQAMADLVTLRLPIFGQENSKVADPYLGFIAGVPRYIGVFGRDTVIAAWQSVLFEPNFLEPALARIALYQGIQYDEWRDEEPYRMLHERRLNPQSEIGRINRSLYYGDVTSTPFWILALSSLYKWVGDRSIIQRFQSTLENCCHWILQRLKEGHGLIYYAPTHMCQKDENRNQAWKDSGDAIVDEQGKVRLPPLALAEIQGYAYQALNEAADLLLLVPSKMSSELLRSEAKKLRRKFNQTFWIEKDSFYALALDQFAQPLRSKASNIGHCLSTGILETSRIPLVVAGLMSEDMFSGWGIRTLSHTNPAFDPFSYHRGSVWPVENALIADGMALLGFREESNQIISGHFCLAAMFQHMRLPEVFGGQPRCERYPIPGIYNYANLLQTWSVSAISQFIQSILGIRPRADLGILYLDPVLPEWISWMTLENLKIGQSRLKLHFWREKGLHGSVVRTRWKVLEMIGNVLVLSSESMKSSELAVG